MENQNKFSQKYVNLLKKYYTSMNKYQQPQQASSVFPSGFEDEEDDIQI